MTAITDLIRRTDERLRSQARVAAGLTEAMTEASLDGVPDSEEALLAARKVLADRKAALAEAQRRVRLLEETLGRMSRALPFLEASWPRQRDRLLTALGNDPVDGLAEWLSYWFTAASARRLDSLRRLQVEVTLPGKFHAIGDRLAIAVRALDEDDWLPCREVLLIGMAGLHIGPRQIPDKRAAVGYVPDGTVRERLRLLAAGLAMHNGCLDEAETLLRHGRHQSAGRLALLSRAARLRGGGADADALLAQARGLDPADLDVAAESIVRTRQHRDPDAALDCARATAESLTSLGDLDGDMGPLVSPPAELWIALAERARDEDDAAGAARLLDHVADDDSRLRAAAAEVRATLDAPAADRDRALLLAGYWRARAGQYDRARRDYEAAVAAAPAGPLDAEIQAAARLRLADVIAVTARQRPYRSAENELEHALELVRGTQPRKDWSYLTQSDLHILLSRVPGRGDRLWQEWAALAAAATAVSVRPEWAAAWLALSEAAITRDLYLVGEAAAARAHKVAPDDETARAGYVRSLISTGRYPDALECLGPADDPSSPDYPWRQCIRGLIALRQGSTREAARYFAGLTIDPAWIWAWNAYIRALVVTGGLDAARHRSAQLLRAGTGREDERSWLAVSAFDARLNGQLDRAHELAAQLSEAAGPDDFRARYALAQTQLLCGDPAGWDLIRLALVADPRPAAIDVWQREELPVLTVLAAGRGVKLAPPADLDTAVRGLRAQQRAVDPVPELWRAAEAAGTDQAKQAADLTEAALATDVPARHQTEEWQARPAPEPPALRLRLPASRVSGNAEPGLDAQLRTWVSRRMELCGAEDLEPDQYQLLADGEVRAGGVLPADSAVPAGRSAGGPGLPALLNWPAAEVIAAAYFQAKPSGSPGLVTVRGLAYRSWVLRGMPAGSGHVDWDVAETAFHQFVAEHAYFGWQKRGGPFFRDPLTDWLAAESEITGQGIIPGTAVDERLRWLIAMRIG